MSIQDKIKSLLALKEDEELYCGEELVFTDTDQFDDYADYDSLLVDSGKGAPE